MLAQLIFAMADPRGGGGGGGDEKGEVVPILDQRHIVAHLKFRDSCKYGVSNWDP